MTDRFTVYDIFAVLVPGVLISSLLVTTTKRLAGLNILDWTGGFGDAALLVIAGYAVGALLQALGHLFFGQIQKWQGKGWRMTQILIDDTNVLTTEMQIQVVKALQDKYGDLPPRDQGATYRKRLEEMAYQAIKEARRLDPLTERFQAENHQMRALVVGFFLLTLVALVSPFGDASHSWWTYVAAGATYAGLCALTFWRMKDKDDTFAKHVYVVFINEYAGKKKQMALSGADA